MFSVIIIVVSLVLTNINGLDLSNFDPNNVFENGKNDLLMNAMFLK
jgi:hypothetical protein